jgi:predicted Zn-dependent protease
VYQLVANAQNASAYTQSKAAADQAQKLNPNNPVYTLNQAQLALTKQDSVTALQYIAQALALKPDYLDAYVLKAQIEVGAGNANAGVQEMTAYTQVAPFDYEGFLLLGQAELQLKDYPDAVTAFDDAKNLAPTNPNIYLDYIQALITGGQKDQAIAALQDFKRKFPEVTGVDEQIQRLESTPSVSAVTTTSNKSAPTKK